MIFVQMSKSGVFNFPGSFQLPLAHCNISSGIPVLFWTAVIPVSPDFRSDLPSAAFGPLSLGHRFGPFPAPGGRRGSAFPDSSPKTGLGPLPKMHRWPWEQGPLANLRSVCPERTGT